MSIHMLGIEILYLISKCNRCAASVQDILIFQVFASVAVIE